MAASRQINTQKGKATMEWGWVVGYMEIDKPVAATL